MAKNRRITPMTKAMGMLKKTPIAIAGTAAVSTAAGMLADKFKKVNDEVDAFDKYWMNRLGHGGQPKLEDFKGDTAEEDFEEALQLYRSMQPLDSNWFR
jgi:hypothetical protein|tara:strand:+ start:6247 stop:6543 length:297 start_codon:yes stop_codon:yes gene_type:complete